MSKNFGKYLIHLLLSFRLRCPSFLLSKFASQLKLIQSVLWVGILGICVINSILRVLLSGFWVSGSQFPSPRDTVSWSLVSGSQFQGQVSGSQALKSQGPWVLGLRVPGLRAPIPGSQVLILDHAPLKHMRFPVNLFKQFDSINITHHRIPRNCGEGKFFVIFLNLN